VGYNVGVVDGVEVEGVAEGSEVGDTVETVGECVATVGLEEGDTVGAL